MKWITALNDTYSGESLLIYHPQQVEEKYITLVSDDPYMSSIKAYEKDGIQIIVTDDYIHDNLVDCIKAFKKDLERSIEWMRDEKNAPPNKPKLYDSKCVEALHILREDYSDQFPEVFI